MKNISKLNLDPVLTGIVATRKLITKMRELEARIPEIEKTLEQELKEVPVEDIQKLEMPPRLMMYKAQLNNAPWMLEQLTEKIGSVAESLRQPCDNLASQLRAIAREERDSTLDQVEKALAPYFPADTKNNSEVVERVRMLARQAPVFFLFPVNGLTSFHFPDVRNDSVAFAERVLAYAEELICVAQKHSANGGSFIPKGWAKAS